jgi:hypothetical protein
VEKSVIPNSQARLMIFRSFGDLPETQTDSLSWSASFTWVAAGGRVLIALHSI